MLSSLTLSVRSESQEEFLLILPSVSDLKMIQCLQAVFQLVFRSPPKLHCRGVKDLLVKTFRIDDVSWEPPPSVYEEREETRAEKKKISLADLGDIPLSIFHEVMEKLDTGVECHEQAEDEVPDLLEEVVEDEEVEEVKVPDTTMRKVDLTEYELPKYGERICSVCEKSFKSWHLLTAHFVRHNSSPEERPIYFCKVCRQWATNRVEIETHKHLTLPPVTRLSFKCDQCDKQFKRKQQLETHQLVHSGLKQFGCEKCGKLFKQRGHLQAHVEEIHETNLEKRDFICSQCGRGFPSRRKLNYHLHHTHSDNKPKKQVCNICGKSFSRAKLRPHQMRDHENNLPFSCQFCDKRFVSKYYVTRHLRQAHKVENIEI